MVVPPVCKSVNVQISKFTPCLHDAAFILISYYIYKAEPCPHTKG